jgi:hypothetical protein
MKIEIIKNEPDELLRTPRGWYAYIESNPDDTMGGYIYPDGSVNFTCYKTEFYNGWYDTKDDAIAAVAEYLDCIT